MPSKSARSGSSAQPRVLALRALKLGDLLVAVPALRALKRHFPDHELVLAAPHWLGPIVDLIDEVDCLLPTGSLAQPLQFEPGAAEVVVNLHGKGPQSHTLLEQLRAPIQIGHAAPGWSGPQWQDGVHERERWTGLLTANQIFADPDDLQISRPKTAAGDHGTVVVHVGAAYGSRLWPVDRFVQVVRFLQSAGQQVLLTGDGNDYSRAQWVAQQAGIAEQQVLAGKVGLADFAGAVAQAALVISADTGAAHLASAYGTPSVVIFGPAPVQEWGPPRTGKHIVLTHSALRVGEVFASTPDPALAAVTAGEVVAACQALLKS